MAEKMGTSFELIDRIIQEAVDQCREDRASETNRVNSLERFVEKMVAAELVDEN
jgi:hypothetical protein